MKVVIYSVSRNPTKGFLSFRHSARSPELALSDVTGRTDEVSFWGAKRTSLPLTPSGIVRSSGRRCCLPDGCADYVSLLVRPGYGESCSFGVHGRYGGPLLFRRLSERPYGLWDGFMRAFCLDV